MANQQRRTEFGWAAALALALVCGEFYALAWQQSAGPQEEDRTRLLWNTKFRQKRPAAAKPAPASRSSAAAASQATPASTAAAQSPATPGETEDAFVGITVWLLRASQAEDDEAVRISTRSEGPEWTPTRIEADTPLGEGQRVRVSIETARTGYLYVIDREEYSDGTFGAAHLIFPTLRTHGGNNAVMGGRLIEIPHWTDNPPYFTMRMSRPDQVAEVLTVLVTPTPLPGLQIVRDALPLTQAQVQEWQKKWGAKVQRLEARGQAGKAYTKAEKEAATERTRLLTHDEPLPQTMYQVEAEPGNPLLINVPLRISR